MASLAFAVEQKTMDTKELVVVYDAGLNRTARQALAAYPIMKQELETIVSMATGPSTDPGAAQ